MDILDEKANVYKALNDLNEFVRSVDLFPEVYSPLYSHISIITSHIDIMLLKVDIELHKKDANSWKDKK